MTAGSGRRRLLAAAAGSAALAVAASRAPVAEGLVPTFAEDFDALDWNRASATAADPGATASGRWATRYWWGDGLRTMATNGERQHYADPGDPDDPFSVEGGVLAITARRSGDPRRTGGLPYVSGILTTEGTFSQRFGVFEMRARLPRGRGLWPAFWLLPQDHGWPPEIDIVEALGQEPGRAHFTMHAGREGRVAASAKGWAATGDLSRGFHDFALRWRPGSLEWRVDGRPAFGLSPLPPGVDDGPMYLLANLAVGGRWPGEPDDDALPARLEIDRIRVWQFPDLL